LKSRRKMKEEGRVKQGKPSPAQGEALLRQLHALSGSRLLSTILAYESPRKLVQQMPREDFFWLIKKVGEEECLPLLKLASVEQWQYLLDLEIWEKDRLHDGETLKWLNRLERADPRRLVRWLFSGAQDLTLYALAKGLEVVITQTDEEANALPPGFFTLDGVFHIRVRRPEYRETIENIIRVMATEDFNRYQALLLNCAGVLPAELEEEMYRRRNVRVAEHGFLPYEEAISVYAPLSSDTLDGQAPVEAEDVLEDEDMRGMVPLSPLNHTGAENMLTEAVFRINDPLLLDRIRLEFAGLCNQILSADGLAVKELEVLVWACRRAASYVNLALERLCGKDLAAAEQALRKHPMTGLFRVGFGLGLKLKWEAERWVKGSWFRAQDLGPEFWGAAWGGMLRGLTERRPRFYTALEKGEEYKDFEWLSELGEGLLLVRRLMVLDGLLEHLAGLYGKDLPQSPELTFHPLLFDLWGRRLLNLKPCFSGLPLKETRDLFRLLRHGGTGPPYDMPGFKEVFVQDMIRFGSVADAEATAVLKEALSVVWEDFVQEYSWVDLDGLDPRYSRFILITDR